MSPEQAAIIEAIERAGSQKALASIAKVPASFVSQWATGTRPVPSKRCLAIELGTGVSRHRLRPDVFPPDDLKSKKPKTAYA